MEVASWECSQLDRQVAAEPLWHGRSLIRHVRIGLEIDASASIFMSGWLQDAWTEPHADGTLRSNEQRRGKLARYRNMDRFLAKLSATKPRTHAEAAFSAPFYKAVVVKNNATEHGMGRARRLADQLGLPLKVIAA